MTLAFFDLETFAIPGEQLPQPVSLAYAIDGGPVDLVHWHETGRWLEACRAILRPGVTSVAFNGGSFDWPDLWKWGTGGLQAAVWRAMREGRCVDPMLTDRLVMHATGRFAPKMRSLAECCKETLGRHVEKEDTWRLRYDELFDVPLDAWPAEAKQYAMDDVVHLRDLHVEHVKRGWIGKHGEPGRYVRTSALEVRSAFWLKLMALPGLPLDAEHVETVWAPEYARQLEEAHQGGMAGKFTSATGKQEQAKIQAAAVRIALPDPGRREAYEAARDALRAEIKASGKKAEDEAFDEARDSISLLLPPGISLTDTAALQVSASACRALRGRIDPNDEATASVLDSMEAAVEHKRIKSQITGDGVKKGRLAEFRSGGLYTFRSRYDSILRTGRTSAGGLHGKASPAALGGNSQNMSGEFDLPVQYRMRSCVRAPAGWLFVDSDYAQLELYTLAQCCLSIVGWSALADVLRSGKDPHAVTGARLARVDLEEFLTWKKTRHHDFAHWRKLAKPFNFGIPGGMGRDRFIDHAREAYGVIIAPEDFWDFKNAYLDTYPEVREYMRIQGKLSKIEVPVSGFLRGGVGYCDACNGPFQSLGGSAMKSAGFEWVRSAYSRGGELFALGARPLVEVHDQFLSMVPEANAVAAAHVQTRIMERWGSLYVPDIPLKVETTICATWNKGLDPARDASGELTIAYLPGEERRDRAPEEHGPWTLRARRAA
jgi:hypothetical protein